MTGRLTALDRIAGVVLALLLVAVGLLALDWHLALVLDLPGTLRTGSVGDVMTSAWWPWVFALVGLLLGALGLRWLLAHLNRSTVTKTRLSTSNETGRLTLDLGSLATVAAERLEQTAPVSDVNGRARAVRGRTLIELTAHVDADADVDELLGATDRCIDEVFQACRADSPVTCRVLISAPRSKRGRRADRVQVS